MTNALVIVESPAKARTLEKYLGKGFKVLASYGHVRDLLSKPGAVDTDNNFSMNYELVEKNAKSVNTIATALAKADTLYLATDPDREGEAISWHLYELLKERGGIENKNVHRIVFYEVTKSAVNEAIANPRSLSHNLIDAQQARRALDHLVGFNLSPLLWKKVQRGLSAGRVQSPALRLIVEREQEIEKFKSREYWSIHAKLRHKETTFQGKLIHYQAEKLSQFSIETEKQALSVQADLTELADGVLTVKEVTRKQQRRQPAPPFITSTLQQEAVRKLGFTAQRTMRVAQQLYEGIDVGTSTVGLITYMRTDSVHLAGEALTELRQYIAEHYGKDKLPAREKQYKTKAKNAQEAHEAVRPTSARRTPAKLKKQLSDEQFRLYELIWKRAVACQMNPALIDRVSIDMECGPGNLFRATGSTIAETGFMEVYLEGRDEPADKNEERVLPPLAQGETVKLTAIEPLQHFTEPPPRYTEASLIKTLEEYGIGRPSTYASIIHTLRSRGYVDLDKKRFIPTDIAKIVSRFLTEHFTDYVDYHFTARLEDELDAVSRGEKERVPLMTKFWRPFSEKIKDKDENLSRSDVAKARVLGRDHKTGLEVSARMGRYGPYAQLGTKDDDDKPRFAGLRDGQTLDTITLEQALQLFELPKNLGQTAAGEEVVASIGRFGPYIRYDGKFVSLKREDDPHTITLERALVLIAEKQKADAEKQIKVFEEPGISVLNGRYGPYITDGKKNAKIPKDKEPAALSLEECVELLAAAKPGKRGGKRKSAGNKSGNKSAKKQRKVKAAQ